MMTPILNRAHAELPSDAWYQLVPLGEFTHPSTGLTQVLDAEACASMANRFAQDAQATHFAGLLVDFDHFSLDTDKPSEAAGWIMEMENRADGLWANILWSDVGESAVKGRRYRFLSPVWNREDCEDLGGGRVRPLAIRNAAVTNDPNLHGIRPLSNRACVEKTATENGGSSALTPMENGMNKEICAALGLPEDASPEMCLAAIEALKAKATEAQCEMENACKARDEMKNRAEGAEQKIAEQARAALEAQVEADLEEHKAVISNRDEVKAALLANRDGTLKLLKGLKPAPQGPDPKTAATYKAAALKNRDELWAAYKTLTGSREKREFWMKNREAMS